MKRLLSILFAAIPMLAMAQGVTDVKLEAAGELSKHIGDSVKFKITELKISGPMNGTDIKLLQQIVNRTKAKEKEGETIVTSVDLSGAVTLHPYRRSIPPSRNPLSVLELDLQYSGGLPCP